MPDRHPFVPPTGGVPSGGALAVRYFCRAGAVTFGDMRNQGLLGVLCLLLRGSVEGPAVSMGHASRWSTLVLSCTTDVAPAAQAWTRSGQRPPVTFLSPIPYPHPHLNEPRSPPPRAPSRHAPRSTTSTLRNAPQPHPPTQRTPSPVSTGFPVPTVSKEHTEPSDPSGDTPHPDATHDTYTTPETNTQNTGSTRTTRTLQPGATTPRTQPRERLTRPQTESTYLTNSATHRRSRPTPTGPPHQQAPSTKTGQHLSRAPHKVSGASQPHHKHATTLEPSHAPAPQWVPCRPRSLHPEKTHRYRRYPNAPHCWTRRTGNAWTQARQGWHRGHSHPRDLTSNRDHHLHVQM